MNWNKNECIKLPSDVRENTLGKGSLRVCPPTAPGRERFSFGGYSNNVSQGKCNSVLFVSDLAWAPYDISQNNNLWLHLSQTISQFFPPSIYSVFADYFLRFAKYRNRQINQI